MSMPVTLIEAFAIKNAPAGKYRIVYRHENGYHKGKEGSLGWPIEIKSDGKGGMTLTPLEIEIPPPLTGTPK